VFERILLPLDGSDVAETALAYGEELSRRLGSELVLYHVHPREHANEGHMHQVYLDKTADTAKSRARDLGANLKVSIRVEEGEAIESICSLVDSHRVDLIVMTAVSTSALSVGKMLGNVADQVCRTVPIPVLLVRPKRMAEISAGGDRVKRILLPTDGSDLSKQAVGVGEELALKMRLDVILFRMAEMYRQYEEVAGSAVAVDYERLDRILQDNIKTELGRLGESMKQKGLSVTSVVTSGVDAAAEIVENCKETGADLVAMSTHGRSGVGRWVFGSVAEKVLRHGETPLLLVHSRA